MSLDFNQKFLMCDTKMGLSRFGIADFGFWIGRENHPVSETLTPLLRKEGSFADPRSQYYYNPRVSVFI